MVEKTVNERQLFWGELNEVLHDTSISVESPKPVCSYIKYRNIEPYTVVEGNVSSRGDHPCESKIWVKFTDNDRNIRNQRAREFLGLLSSDVFSAEIDSREADHFAKVIIYDTHSTQNTSYQDDAITTANLLSSIEDYLHSI